MIKLLNAGIYRLLKNKIFWFMIIITIIIAIVSLLNQINGLDIWGKRGIDKLLLNYTNWIGIFIALFTSLFVGLEYETGAIRNKIIVGHSRWKIYISNLIISVLTGLILEIIYMLIICAIGIPILGGIKMQNFLIVLLNILMITIAYSAIFTFIVLTCSNITIGTAISMILFIIMFIANIIIDPIASADKYNYNIYENENGELVKEIAGINLNYPGDVKKKIAQSINYLIPFSQAQEINNITYSKNIEELYTMQIYAFVETLLVTLIGLYIFKNKEVK